MKFVASITAFFTFILSLLGVYTVEDVGGFENKSWMKDIPDSKYISEISIPGSHDTAAVYEIIYNVAKTQDYTLADQLDMGVRFLDIRLQVSFNEAKLVHGILPMGETFDGVMKTCLDFLEENPDEVIIMSVKQDSSPMFSSKTVADVVAEAVESNPTKWFVENSVPRLGDVRGKIVLFNRYSEEGMGINAVQNFPKNKSGVIENESNKVFVQDHFKLGSLPVETKWTEAKDLYSLCHSDNELKSNLYINFLSGYTGLVLPNIRAVADEMNKNALGYFSSAEKGSYGVTLFDFVNQDLCNAVISTNF